MAQLDLYGIITRVCTKLKDRFAAKTHLHSAADVTTGTLPIARGGTGLTSSPSMLANLGSTTADNVLKASPRPGVTGTLPIANGGTGATTAAAAVVNVVDGQALKPASVAATGEVSGKSGTTTHKLTNKAESSAVAYVEGTTATKNHAVGDYFILGGVLMKTTASIATGETITTSNATPATVQAQIDALRDSVAVKTLYFDVAGVTNGICVKTFGRATFVWLRGIPGDTSNIFKLPNEYRPTPAGVNAFNAKATIDYDGTVNTVASGVVWDQFMYIAG